MRTWLVITFIMFTALHSRAQFHIKDSAIFITSVRPSYSYQIPGGDLAKRFGWNSNLGMAVDIKTRKSIFFGLEGGFIFGNKVLEDVLYNLKNSDGEIIDQEGGYSTVLTYQRGIIVTGYTGYLFRVWNPNPNSGIMVTLGAGYMQHKIRIEHNRDKIPALEGDYLKGYDRYTNGICFKQFVGYQFLSNSRLWNFYVGVEAYQGLTESRRDWNFDQMKKETGRRTDLLFGLRAGWVLPLYKRAPKEYYFN